MTRIFKVPEALRRAIIITSSLVGKGYLKYLSNFTAINQESLVNACRHRGERPLISVCNHTATIDDPLIFSTLPWDILWNTSGLRWGLGAKEICFKNSINALFFSAVQIIPIVRGHGIHQEAMKMALERLDRNEWIHLFSEGQVNQSSQLLRFKWGIAHLILNSKTPPLVVPFYHHGIHSVLPLDSLTRKSNLIPRIGQTIRMHFGEVIDTKPLLDQVRQKRMDEVAARIYITQSIQDKVQELQKLSGYS